MSYFSKKLLNNYIFCLLIFHSIYFFLNSIPSMSFLNLHHPYIPFNLFLLKFHSIYVFFKSSSPLCLHQFRLLHSMASYISFHLCLIYVFFFSSINLLLFQSLLLSPYYYSSNFTLAATLHLPSNFAYNFFSKPFAALPPIYSIFWPQPKKVNTLSISSILFLF